MRLSSIVALLCFANLGCTKQASETHLIPDGYTGPVVIVFRDASGVNVDTQKGERTFQLPSSGVLRIKGPAPAAGIAHVAYLYVSGPHGKRELPLQKGNDELQVFGVKGGEIGSLMHTKADGEVITRGPGVEWRSYIVGAPSARTDWAQLQHEFVKAAAGDE
jgi:hypothetical protein